jgi:hypothetical protein
MLVLLNNFVSIHMNNSSFSLVLGVIGHKKKTLPKLKNQEQSATDRFAELIGHSI